MDDDRYFVEKLRRRYFVLERTDDPEVRKAILNPKTGKLGFDTKEEAEAHLSTLIAQKDI